jgi:hypothetical protein
MILAHHTCKRKTNPFSPPELEDKGRVPVPPMAAERLEIETKTATADKALNDTEERHKNVILPLQSRMQETRDANWAAESESELAKVEKTIATLERREAAIRERMLVPQPALQHRVTIGHPRLGVRQMLPWHPT